ncbi:MAG TPA: YdeI/OmpD-associated family protein [Acidobacteriaceae bacterium]|jgi:uncharacterized protein YdeI (YjbR/CyaY-like superfamily)
MAAPIQSPQADSRVKWPSGTRWITLGRVGNKKKFRAVLERDNTALKWVIVRLPFDATKVWTTRKRLRVKGAINGFPFRTSLFGSARGGHLLLVNKEMQKGARVTVGSMAEIVLEPDLEERTATVPAELAKLLKEERSLKKWFEQLSYSIRKYIADAVNGPKSAEARVRRAEQMAERMMLAMEGERELPPILQVAFQRYPQARAGWEAMTAVQRRGHLLGIFYYQSPESRQKRVDKAVDEALKAAKRNREPI